MDPETLPGHAYRAMTEFVAAAGRRRRLPACLHLGLPAAAQVRVVEQDWYDAGVRADLVCRALEGLAVAEPIAWLARTGDLAGTDLDQCWLAACRHGFARHRLPFHGLFVVTRRGWANRSTGEEHRWVRVRPPAGSQRGPSAR